MYILIFYYKLSQTPFSKQFYKFPLKQSTPISTFPFSIYSFNNNAISLPSNPAFVVKIAGIYNNALLNSSYINFFIPLTFYPSFSTAIDILVSVFPAPKTYKGGL